MDNEAQIYWSALAFRLMRKVGEEYSLILLKATVKVDFIYTSL